MPMAWPPSRMSSATCWKRPRRRRVALALSANEREPWAQHALAHVLLTQGRIEEGTRLLEGWRSGWTGELVHVDASGLAPGAVLPRARTRRRGACAVRRRGVGRVAELLPGSGRRGAVAGATGMVRRGCWRSMVGTGRLHRRTRHRHGGAVPHAAVSLWPRACRAAPKRRRCWRPCARPIKADATCGPTSSGPPPSDWSRMRAASRNGPGIR